MDQIIKNAISQRFLIQFMYHGLLRIAEPHVYGILSGKYQVLVCHPVPSGIHSSWDSTIAIVG